MTFEEQLKTMRFHVIDGTTRLDEHGIRSLLIAVRELVKEEAPATASRNPAYANGFKDGVLQFKTNIIRKLDDKRL